MSDHIFIATPCYGGLVTQTYMQSVIACMVDAPLLGFRMSLGMLGNDALITRGRNTLAHQFLHHSDASHLLFIDADIGFAASDIATLLRAKKPVVGGMYPLREHVWDALTQRLIEAGEPPQTACLRYVGESEAMRASSPESDLMPVAYAGTGFLLITRAILEALVTAHPETRYRRIDARLGETSAEAPSPHALFDCLIDPATGTYLSEDFAFCQRVRAIGGEIWIDRTIRLSHTGSATFMGAPMTRPALQSSNSYENLRKN